MVHDGCPRPGAAAPRSRRGIEFIQAINEVFPGCAIVLAFGSCIVHADVTGYAPTQGKQFSHARYALLAPLIDGMLLGADAGAKIVDASELLCYKTADEFARAPVIVRPKCPAYRRIPEFYSKHTGRAGDLFHPSG